MKVIFLDIDGVLNSNRTIHAFGGMPQSLKPKEFKKFDPVAIALVKRLCREAGAKVVISSSWRKREAWQTIGAVFKLPVIDATPIFPGDEKPGVERNRGKEVALFLSVHPSIKTYVIIDDNDDYLEQQKQFRVLVDRNRGFSLGDFYKALKILGEQSGNE